MKRLLYLFVLTTTIHAEVPVIALKDLMQYNPNIVYQKCSDILPFSYKPFPLSINQSNHPCQSAFAENFILKIPHATVQSYGIVLVNNHYIAELVWKGWYHNLAKIFFFADHQKKYAKGKVAVIGQAALHNYWHWLTEALCRLALLEMQGVEYDYVYSTCFKPYMVQTLHLWGLDPAKVIVSDERLCLQAEELIVPSLVSNLTIPAPLFTCYVQPHLLAYVREKLLTAALKQGPSQSFAPRVFVSRKDAPHRKILNEDAVFSLLQQKGFVRYELEKLSVVDQILLFHNAEMIVAPQGTSMANTIFCTPKTKIFELFQGLNDCTFWYLSQELNLNYTPVPTCIFIPDYFKALTMNTSIPLSVIQQIVDQM